MFLVSFREKLPIPPYLMCRWPHCEGWRGMLMLLKVFPVFLIDIIVKCSERSTANLAPNCEPYKREFHPHSWQAKNTYNSRHFSIYFLSKEQRISRSEVERRCHHLKALATTDHLWCRAEAYMGDSPATQGCQPCGGDCRGLAGVRLIPGVVQVGQVFQVC